MLICFSKCNLHFQSVLICVVLNAENITKIYHKQQWFYWNSTKFSTSMATSFTWLNKSFWIRTVLISYILVVQVQGAKNILNNSYKVYCVKCPWFWFWLILSHTQQEQFSLAWMRLWISGYHIDLPLALVHWKAAVSKKFQLLLKSFKALFNSKWMWSFMTACKLMEESAIKGTPS